MNTNFDKETPIKFPDDLKEAIIHKEIKVMQFLNKRVQISYNLN